MALVVVAMTAGCNVDGLNFREDTRVSITSPGDRAQVELPVTVEWVVEDFDVTREGEPRDDAGFFGVFVDRAPQPPGEALAWLARDDEACQALPACPDDDWLARRRVFTTTDSSFTIEQLPRPRDERRALHEVTIVLLNSEGERIGESAFAIEFEVVRSN